MQAIQRRQARTHTIIEVRAPLVDPVHVDKVSSMITSCEACISHPLLLMQPWLITQMPSRTSPWVA